MKKENIKFSFNMLVHFLQNSLAFKREAFPSLTYYKRGGKKIIFPSSKAAPFTLKNHQRKTKTRSNCPMGKLKLLQQDEFALNRAQTVKKKITHICFTLSAKDILFTFSSEVHCIFEFTHQPSESLILQR